MSDDDQDELLKAIDDELQQVSEKKKKKSASKDKEKDDKKQKKKAKKASPKKPKKDSSKKSAPKSKSKGKKRKTDDDDEEESDLPEESSSSEQIPAPAIKAPSTPAAGAGKASAVPLKKRRTDAPTPATRQSEEGEIDPGSDAEAFMDGYGSDLMGDEKDREWLSKLSEREREGVLAQRWEQRKELRERWEAKARSRASQGEPPTPRSATRTRELAAKKQAKASVFEELRARRAQAPGSSEAKEMRDQRAAAILARQQESQRDDEEEAAHDRSPKRDESDHEPARPSEEEATREDLERIRVKRTQLEKWFMEDFFEESIRGLYVRVGIGMNHKKEPVYRVAEVSEAKQGTREYRFGGRLTRKVIMCHQAGAAKAFPLEVVSNSPFTESEFARYADECRKRNRMPSREDVRSREAALNKMANHHYTPEEVLQIIARKKQEKGVARPVNIALERARLYLEREAAATAGDEARLAKADADIAQLDEWTREDEDRARAKVDMSKINEKNERVNQEVLKQKARARDIREAQEAKGGKVDDLDPFSRRPTAPSVMYIPASQLEQEKAQQKAEEERRKALQKQKLEEAEARKRKARGLDISFDGVADLFEEQPAAAPVLASIPLPSVVEPAPAPIVKPVSLPVPPAASPGLKALSLDDYKRRRGLA